MLKQLFRKQAQTLIGLDIGTRYVKAVLLEKNGSTVSVQKIACEAISGNAFSDREVKEYDAVSNALRKVMNTLKPKNKQVAVAVAGGSVISKTIQMEPNQTDYELEGQIEIEADSLIPYPLTEVYLDFEELGPSDSHDDKVDVLLSAAHKDNVDSRITLLRETQFEPKIMDIEGYALGNALRHFLPQQEEPVVCLNIGASLLQVCVLHNDRVIYSKEHNFGFDSLINDISLANALERQEAENQLVNNELPEIWRETTYPIFQSNLQQRIARAMQAYMATTHNSRPEEILICGGGAKLAGLAEDLEHDLAVKVDVFDPFASMKINDKLDAKTVSQFAPQLAIAAGLASRSFETCHI